MLYEVLDPPHYSDTEHNIDTTIRSGNMKAYWYDNSEVSLFDQSFSTR